MDTNHVLAPQSTALNWAFAAAIVVVLLGLLLFFLGALVSVLRSDLTGGMKVVWVLFAFWAPFLGPLVWFLLGKRDAERRGIRV